jgi:hypothetical protein
MGSSENNLRPGDILAKAVERAASPLGLTSGQLALILGINESDLGASIDPESRVGIRARQLIQIYQHLYALTGNDSSKMTHWMKTRNRQFTSAPIDRMQNTLGLEEIITYLELLCP